MLRGGQNELYGGASAEFERLMEDSVDSEGIPAGATSLTQSAEGIFLLRTSVVADSPARPCIASPAPTTATPAPRPRSLGGPAEASWALGALSSRLEDITRDLKRNVEHEFMLAERSLASQHRAEMETQRLQAETLICKLQSSLEVAEGDRTKLTKRLETKQRKLKESLTLLSRVRTTLVGRVALEAALRGWKDAASARKDEKMHDQLASKVRSSRVLGVTFGAWRRLHLLAWRETLVAHERAAADTVRAKMMEHMEMERDQLKKQVEELGHQLAEESRQRALLQENLKRVFMRGVCALNFEAMSLLSSGSSEPVPETPGGFDWQSAGALLPSSTAGEVILQSPLLQTTLTSSAEITKLPEAKEVITEVKAAAQEAKVELPRQVPAPLPFVSYVGPVGEASAEGAPAKGLLSKGQRWVTASAAPVGLRTVVSGG